MLETIIALAFLVGFSFAIEKITEASKEDIWLVCDEMKRHRGKNTKNNDDDDDLFNDSFSSSSKFTDCTDPTSPLYHSCSSSSFDD